MNEYLVPIEASVIVKANDVQEAWEKVMAKVSQQWYEYLSNIGDDAEVTVNEPEEV